MFENLDIWKDEKYRELQGTYPVIFLSFAAVKAGNLEDAKTQIKQEITRLYWENRNLMKEDIFGEDERELYYRTTVKMDDVTAQDSLRNLSVWMERYYGKKVIILLDEYDTPMQEAYVQGYWDEFTSFVRSLFNASFKTNPYLERAIMTGITRVSKESIFSDLNNLRVVTTTSNLYADCFGFTEEEVFAALDEYGMGDKKEEVKQWYDGYDLKGIQIYNPRSVVMSLSGHDFDSYWTKTETYEALKKYIQMDMYNLKELVTRLIAGSSIEINPDKFQNDMTTFASADDVLTLLVHLGYLTYDFDTCTVHIPNQEVQKEFINCIEDGGWEPVMDAIRKSEELLAATIRGEEETVARMIENAHQENTSILAYNDENSLACVIALAYYSAKKNYVVYRELAGGKGFADMVFVPRKTTQTPAIVVELKWNQTAEAAITQIKRKQYVESLKDYRGEVILVGINYESKELKKDDYKKHSCKIERITMA